MAADDDWPVVIRNLTKARAVWRRMMQILSREGERPWVSGFFFKAVIHSVLLFGAETWVVTPCMGWDLKGVQNQVARQLTGRLRWRGGDGNREHTPVEAAREEVGLETMETYIHRRQNTVV